MNTALIIAIEDSFRKGFWDLRVVVVITVQLHSTKSELKFCTGENPASVLYIYSDTVSFELFILKFLESHYMCSIKVAVSKHLQIS